MRIDIRSDYADTKRQNDNSIYSPQHGREPLRADASAQRAVSLSSTETIMAERQRNPEAGNNRTCSTGDGERARAGSETLVWYGRRNERGQETGAIRRERAMENVKSMTEPISPPRAVRKGEFYCHACSAYIALRDHDKHRKLHLTLAWKPGRVKP